MQVIGFNLTKILSERKKAPEGKIEVKSNINITSIAEEKLDLLKDKEVLKFSFEFSVDYSPNIAVISFEGFILAIVEKEKMKDILKKWKTKKLVDEARIPLFNLILTKCSLKALQFEEEFNLPPHIPLPKVSQQQNNQGYVQ